MAAAVPVHNAPPSCYEGLTYLQCKRRRFSYVLLGALGIALLGACGVALSKHRDSWVCKGGMGLGVVLGALGLCCARRWQAAR